MDQLKKVCPFCKNIFETTKKNKKYCCSTCKIKHNGMLAKLSRCYIPKKENFVHQNIQNNTQPLAGDIVRLSNNYNNIKKNTLGVITGVISENQEKYEIVFNPILPANISLDKTISCEGGIKIVLETKNLCHSKITNMLYCYPDRNKADDLFLVNEYKTVL